MYNRIKQTEQTMSVPTTLIIQAPKMTLTVEEMADELNISSPTAYSLVKEATFPAFRIGQRILINRSGLQKWLDRQCELKAETCDEPTA